VSHPSSNPDAPALKLADPHKLFDGCYAIVSDDGSRRRIFTYSRDIASARLVAAGLSEKFPAIYCRLEGKWRLVH
jgi:hypothetical protein